MSNATAMREAVDRRKLLEVSKTYFKNCFEPYCVKARIFITFESIGITVRALLPAALPNPRKEGKAV